MLAAHSPHSVHIRWMPTDLHTQPQRDLRPALQAEIDKIEQETDGCDAILLGYGLCSMGTAGLKSRSISLIIPRAHDCITMLLGSREKYQEIFEKYSGGVYWYSPGWIEQFKTPGRGYDEQAKYMEYVEKYGEEDRRLIIERQKQAVLAEGGTWIDPEERARLEQEEADRKAEEERIAELRARCEKEGLDFDAENQKYFEEQEKRKNSLIGKLFG
jgi:hypothetical protein